MRSPDRARTASHLLIASLLAACAPAADEDFIEQAQPALALHAPRPVCGTRPLGDSERVIDEASVRDLKRSGRLRRADGVTTITTYVHVIHDGDNGLVSPRTIDDQIEVLNGAYAAHGIQFELAASVAGNPNPDFTDNADWYEDSDEIAYKTALHEGTGDDLNLYTNSGGGYLGYAYYPTIVDNDLVLDGVVLAWGTLPGANQPGISDVPGLVYNLGDTATHEVGHYLGLAHTFEGGCSRKNDEVSDTPAERSADYYCTEGRNSCRDGRGPVLLDPIHNFMDYSDDVCLTEFTAGQSERMLAQWILYREGN